MRNLVLVPTENKRYITSYKINSVGQESGSRRLTVQQRWIVLENKYSLVSSPASFLTGLGHMIKIKIIVSSKDPFR